MIPFRPPFRTLACALLAVIPALAQQPQMPGMSMPQPPTSTQSATTDTMPGMMPGSMMQPPKTLIAAELQHTSSGTTIEPFSTPMSMWMGRRAGWQLMLHGNAFLADIQQHAANSLGMNRGADKLFSTNWIMPMATHRLGLRSQLTLRTMLDLEPATITHREYPELFQQGETAYGKPIIDGQHPHDAIMELAVLYDLHTSEHTLLSLYAAPIGDPAIGPTAYPHRQSASEDPIAALGHHQEDSTHIAFNVFTTGLTWKWARLEASGFHGAEPDEARWHFQPSPNGLAVDSYSTRLTVTPTPNLSAQYSIAHITSPEALSPTDNQRRQTASVMFNRPIGAHHDTSTMPGMDMATVPTGNWSTTLLWGQTLTLPTLPSPVHTQENSYLLESLLQFHTRNFLWTRIESAARTSELLSSPGATPRPERSIGHVQAYSFGYDRQYRIAPHLLAAPGAQFTLYRTPNSLAPTYGRYPVGGVAFIRFRLAP